MTTTRFRKRPIEVDTVQWTGGNEAELIAFTGHRFEPVPVEDRAERPDTTAQVYDELHDTWVGVKTGQHVVRGVKGEFYPIAEDVLAETYERVDGGTASAEQRAEAASRLGTRYMVRAEKAEAAIERVRTVLDDPSALDWRQRIRVAIEGEPCGAASHASNALGTESCSPSTPPTSWRPAGLSAPRCTPRPDDARSRGTDDRATAAVLRRHHQVPEVQLHRSVHRVQAAGRTALRGVRRSRHARAPRTPLRPLRLRLGRSPQPAEGAVTMRRSIVYTHHWLIRPFYRLLRIHRPGDGVMELQYRALRRR